MNATDHTAIEVSLAQPIPSKFDRERRAFFRLLPTLLETHRGQYVAVHNEQIVDCGPDRLSVAHRVLSKIGPTDIYVERVDTEVRPPCRSGVIRNLAGREAQE